MAFAQQADKEKLSQVAKLFRAAAEAETIHAHNHFRVMGGVKSTKDNLKAAMEGENYEYTKMYPSFIKDSESDGNKDAKRSFDLANKVEQIHYKLYDAALKAIEGGKDLPKKELYVCPVCGYTHEGVLPEKCPVCGAPGKSFKKID